MADHVREQIIAAAVAQLTGLATTGANVFGDRVHPLQDTELPGLLVNADNEEINTQTAPRPRTLERNMVLAVTAQAKSNAALRTTLNTIIKEVESALATPSWMGALAKDCVITNIIIDRRGDGEKPVGQADILFRVFYMTLATTPDAPI